MKYTTESLIIQVAPARLHALVVFSFLLLALLGQTPESSAGRITNPPPLLSTPDGTWSVPTLSLLPPLLA